MTGGASGSVHEAPREAIEAVAQRCRTMVRKRAGLAALGGAVPVPGLDLAIDAAVLIGLLEQINEQFGLTEAQVEALAPSRRRTVLRAIAAVGSSTVGRALTRTVMATVIKRVAGRLAARSVLRYVPLVGQVVAGTLAYAAVRYIGERHIEDCVAVHARLTAERGQRRRAKASAEDGVARAAGGRSAP